MGTNPKNFVVETPISSPDTLTTSSALSALFYDAGPMFVGVTDTASEETVMDTPLASSNP